MTTIDIKEKDGSITKYFHDQNGVIKQLYPKPFVYDSNYVAVYDTPLYKKRSLALQRLRVSIIEALLPKDMISDDLSLLDCGYGNGDFLRYAKESKAFQYLFGHDVSDVEPPSGIGFIKDILRSTMDIITFWDCLEHFPEISWLADLPAKMIVLSLPHCHHNAIQWDSRGIWFTDWHHRKPNEHIYHFDKASLIKTMNMYGWKCISFGNPEDIIRTPRDFRTNILTAAFIRKNPV